VKLHVDLETLQLIEGPGFRNPVTSLRFKRGDAAQLEVMFLDGGTTPVAIGDPGTLEIRFGIKPRNRYDIGYLVHSADWTMPAPDAESPAYQCSPSFNTVELDSALGVGSATGTELSEITLMGEITWREGSGEPTSTRTFLVVVENDVNRGTEGVPVSAEPPYPAPDVLATTHNLGGKAVLHDTAQTLTSEQKAQARANIGALGDIADGSLTIAKTAGLQTALNGKASSTHTHQIGDVQALETELALRVEFRVGVGPDELDAGDSQKPLILEKDGTVWFYNPTTGAFMLAEQTAPTGPTEQIVAGQYGQIAPTNPQTIEPGNYLVTISIANFSTSSWGSHGLMLKSNIGGNAFSNPSPGSLYGLYPDQADSWAAFFLEDPAIGANPQVGTIACAVYSTCGFYVDGTLPTEGDSADLTITFTPI
jgi:hypothetical protein